MDDDLILESYVISNMRKAIAEEGYGFVGSALIGLSYRNDVRPHQQYIEFWEGRVQPEYIVPFSRSWNRYLLHNVAKSLACPAEIPAQPSHGAKVQSGMGGRMRAVRYPHAEKRGRVFFLETASLQTCGEDVLAQLRETIRRFCAGRSVSPGSGSHPFERKVNASGVLEMEERINFIFVKKDVYLPKRNPS
jgi:hypothetical protein